MRVVLHNATIELVKAIVLVTHSLAYLKSKI